MNVRTKKIINSIFLKLKQQKHINVKINENEVEEFVSDLLKNTD